MQAFEDEEQLERQLKHAALAEGGTDLQSITAAPVARRKGKRRLQTGQKRLRKVQAPGLTQAVCHSSR